MSGRFLVDAIICGDCAEVMRGFPGECIDLTVTSPPYGNLRDYNGYVFDFGAIAQELWRVTKLGGVVVWVVADQTIDGSESGESFRQALRFREIGFNLETMIYGVAGTGAKGSNYYWQAFEYMFVLAKGQPKTSNRIADVRNLVAGRLRGNSPKNDALRTRRNRRLIIGKEYSVRPNVWRYAFGGNPNQTVHPAPFPERLAEDHIISWSNPGDVVLDPMCGSGTTCKMAKVRGRHYIGIDISEEYCELSRKRVECVQPNMFDWVTVDGNRDSELNGKTLSLF